MIPDQPMWCGQCFLRIAPYDTKTAYNGSNYHQACFLKLVREEAEEQKMRRANELTRYRSDQRANPTRLAV